MSTWWPLYLAGALGSLAYKASADEALRVVLQGLDPPPYYLKPRYRVSLVVPAFNEIKYLGNLLRSAQNQTEAFSEIVVADCSDPGEGTAALARSWGAKIVQAPQGNIGLSRNLGGAAANGDILAFADADMILAQTFTETALNILESGAVLAHPKEVFYDSPAWRMVLHLPQMFRGNHEPSGCVVVRRVAFISAGGYDESYQTGSEGGRAGEDSDFGRRVIQAFGPQSVRVMPLWIGASGRRWKKFGFFGHGPQFATPVRARLPRDGVQSVTNRR